MKRYTKRTAYIYHPKMPEFLADAQKRVATFEDQPYKYFPDLALRPGHVKTTYIQFRRKIVSTLTTSLACMESRRRRLGHPIPESDPPKFRCYTNKQLCKRSKLYPRAWQRSLEVARRYVHVKDRAAKHEDEDGSCSYQGFAAVRIVDESLFHRIGLHEEWVTACDEADLLLRSERGDETATAELIKRGVIVPPRPAPSPQTDEERFAVARVRAIAANAALKAKPGIDSS